MAAHASVAQTGRDPVSWEIAHSFRFEAAHRLPNAPEGHKCRRLHGHSYEVEIHLAGPLSERKGWIRDFGDLASAWAPIENQLDHRYLNEIEGLENPTSEVLAAWIWDRIAPALPGLSAIVVAETCATKCVYRGP
jgi:6-pyruvoyltetrahydropterin/6-carboxytetrahydropterin synthase